MSALRRRLAQAELKLAIAKKEATQAQRKEDRASEVVRALQEEIAWVQLRQWGSTPDLAELMRSDGTGGMVFYKALSAIAESWGLHVFGTWSDTKQLVLSFGLNRAQQGAIERVEQAINYFAPAMKRIKGGWVRFSVSHPQPEACAWELRYAPKSGRARLARLVYGADDSVLDFASLRGALEYVEQNLWLEDIIDAPPTAALEYVIAAEGMEGGMGDRKLGPVHFAGALTNGWLRPTCRFKVVDLGPGGTPSREVVYRADFLEQAQEAYIAACEAAGIVHGTLRIFRCADWAAYA